MTVITSAASGLAAIPWILVWSWRSKDDLRSSTVRFGFDFDEGDNVDDDDVLVSSSIEDDVDVRKSP